MTADALAAVRIAFEASPTLSQLFMLSQRLLQEPPPDDVETQRIAVIGSGTLDYIASGMACAVAQEGVWPVLYQAPFGTWVQQALLNMLSPKDLTVTTILKCHRPD